MSNPFDKHPNAQKWTAETVTDIPLAIEIDARNGDSYFFGKALTKQGLYRHVWSYWKKTFYNDDDIIELMLRIESLFEAKLLDGALRNKISAWVAVLTLKNNYHWSEKPSQSHMPSLHRRGE